MYLQLGDSWFSGKYLQIWILVSVILKEKMPLQGYIHQ